MEFLTLIAVIIIAYLIWRISDQLPDIMFRLGEIQRDVAELRRELVERKASESEASASGTQQTNPGGDAG